MCAALSSSLQQTEGTDSKQVGPVAARPLETLCSAVELAVHNGPIQAGGRSFPLWAAQIQELGLDPRGWRAGLSF